MDNVVKQTDNVSPDMRKGVAAQPLAVEISMDCGNVMLAALNCSYIHFLKLKYYGNFTYIANSNTRNK